MNSIEQVKEIIKKFSRNELSEFRHWFEEYDSNIWDLEIEEDAKFGKLEKLFANLTKENI